MNEEKLIDICENLDDLGRIIDSMTSGSLSAYENHMDLFHALHYRCNQISAGLSQIETRYVQVNQQELLDRIH
mgnify:FL=1